ncbi:tRNA-specific adenosine deaminase 2 [Chrysoperla carnea]|uniref:tRNA-specific adenosine deaminase 2 n=1 Tax=Chrysoperla carnea TaxID=189513 RepID=UPI001D093ADF|nr:tRNA-specific adenosine deaminase 2 [Chrysoperla carnea]
MDAKDSEYMQVALNYAKEALNAQEVPVGCIFIYKGFIIASGRNTVNETKNATRHAEFNCIDQVYEYCRLNNLLVDKVFQTIDVYVTVEPCIMCAAALFETGIRTIVYGCKNDRFGGETVVNVSNFVENNCKIKGGLFADEAMELLKEFYKGVNPNAPKPNIKGKQKS